MLKEIAKQIKIVCDNEIEEEAIVNALLAKIVCIAGIKNIRFDSGLNKFGTSPVAHYALNFIPSGGNKGNLNKALNSLFGFIKRDIDEVNKKIKEDYVEEELRDLSVKEQKKYMKKIIKEAEMQEQLMPVVSDATPEGLYDSAELINKIQKGFIFINNTEFANYFATAAIDNNSNNALFLNVLYDLWDGIYSAARKIRGKIRVEQTGISCSALLTSAFRKMSNPTNMKYFKESLSVGNARRFLFYYDPKIDYFLNPPEEPSSDEIENANKVLEQWADVLKQKYDTIKQDEVYYIEKNTTECIKQWHKKYCLPREKELRGKSESINNEILLLYLHHSKWTIAKLLVIIHLINEPKKTFIKTDYLKYAIDFWENSYKSLENIILAKNPTQIDKFVNCFIDNANKALCRNDIMQMCDMNHNDFKQIFEDCYLDIEAQLQTKGYELKAMKGRANTKNYKCVPISKTKDTFFVSYSTDMTKNYKFEEMNTDTLIELIRSNCNFVAGELKDGYRKDENYLGNQKTIWLDFEDSISLDEAREVFKPYWYIMYTTRSNGIKGTGDRFRVILQTDKELPKDKEKYKEVMANIIKDYDADSACCNASRFYYGNDQAIVYTNEGICFEWQNFDIEQPVKVKTYNDNTPKSDDTLCDNNIFTINGDRILAIKDIKTGNRDQALAHSVGILISAVKSGKLSHSNALRWLDNVLSQITTRDFKENADKFRKRLERLEF